MAARIVRDKRIVSRKRKSAFRKFSVFLWVLFGIAVFAGTIMGLNYFYNSDYFKIKNIELINNDYYNKEEIETFLGSLIGKNIFEIDKKQTELSVEGNYSRIKKAELKKIFPDKIEIIIEERMPYLRIGYKEKIFLIDDEGVFLEEISSGSGDYDDLIIVKNVINYLPDIGNKIAKKNVLSIGQIYDSMTEDIRSHIDFAGVNDDSFGDIFFNTVDNKIILYGNTSELTKKNLILEQILKEIENESISYSIIDIRITDSPIIK